MIFPVKKDDFSLLGQTSQLQVAIALTNHKPDLHDFDNFPHPSQKDIEAAKAKEEADARALEEQKLKEEAALKEAQKPKVKSTTKVEQVSTISNVVVHIWATAEEASAVMVRMRHYYFTSARLQYKKTYLDYSLCIANTLKRHSKTAQRHV